MFVVDRKRSTCGWCHKIAPLYSSLAVEYKDRLVFVKVDAARLYTLKQQLGVNGLPTFHFYRNSQKIDEIIGANEPQYCTSLPHSVCCRLHPLLTSPHSQIAFADG